MDKENKSTEYGKKHAAMFWITWKCFITVNIGMVRVIIYRLRNMKSNIINRSEVSRLSVVIQPFSPTFFTTSLNWVKDRSFMSCGISLLANSIVFSSVGFYEARNKSDETNTMIIFIDAALV